MDIYEVFRKRYSYRAYTDRPIPADALKRMGEAVSLAPTACNLQPFEIQVVLNDTLRTKIASVYSRGWLQSAPAIAVAIGDRGVAWKRAEGDSIIDVDIGIVMQHFVLAAQAEGLGTCWICAFERAAMDAVMGLAGTERSVVAITPVGYPTEEMRADKRPERKPLEDIYRILD
ncbi:MAG: nitroreductase family protein [Kiritimatiellia bacterium]|jgi:nitroreductase